MPLVGILCTYIIHVYMYRRNRLTTFRVSILPYSSAQYCTSVWKRKQKSMFASIVPAFMRPLGVTYYILYIIIRCILKL